MRTLSSSVLLSSVLAITLAGCGGAGGDASVEVGITAQALQAAAPSSGGTGTTTQRHLVISVAEVNVHVAATKGGDNAKDSSAPGNDTGGSGWVTVFSGKTDVDLFDAASTEELLGSMTVPAGKITQVRLVLAGADLVEGATTTAVACPSCSESGLKIVTEGKAEVAAGDTLHLALDFDQTKSLTQDEAGYRLAPVIKVATSSGN
ncbi:MAG: DUF4382 domain-containing protein [Byssovorax sp.]